MGDLDIYLVQADIEALFRPTSRPGARPKAVLTRPKGKRSNLFSFSRALALISSNPPTPHRHLNITQLHQQNRKEYSGKIINVYSNSDHRNKKKWNCKWLDSIYMKILDWIFEICN